MRDLGFERPDWGGLSVLEDSAIATFKFPALAPKPVNCGQQANRFEPQSEARGELFSSPGNVSSAKEESLVVCSEKPFELQEKWTSPGRPPLRKCKLGKRSWSTIF